MTAWLPHIKAMVVGLIVTVIMTGVVLVFATYPMAITVAVGLFGSYVIGVFLVGVWKL